MEAVGNLHGFVSRKCDSYLLYQLGFCKNNEALNIGGEFTAADGGRYYLKTNSKKPYSKE